MARTLPGILCQSARLIPYLRTMLDLTNKNIALLKGGPGSERLVSLKTAESVAAALRSKGATVTEVDVTGPEFDVPLDCFIAMNLIHGTFGEDGEIQAIMETCGVRYTGAGVHSSRIAFDKVLMTAAAVKQIEEMLA
jgi:D-alanine-D-alanine ligase